eukprot:1142484-Pelagomonas_calceolata.AAC.3
MRPYIRSAPAQIACISSRLCRWQPKGFLDCSWNGHISDVAVAGVPEAGKERACTQYDECNNTRVAHPEGPAKASCNGSCVCRWQRQEFQELQDKFAAMESMEAQQAKAIRQQGFKHPSLLTVGIAAAAAICLMQTLIMNHDRECSSMSGQIGTDIGQVSW